MLKPEQSEHELTLDGIVENACRKYTSMPDSIAEALRLAIIQGVLKEGQQLLQDEIAAKFGTSKIPVREALRKLEAQGFVTINPHRGAAVKTFSLKEVLEAFELRLVLEPMLLEKAIPLITSKDLDQAVATLDALAEEEDTSRWGELNWEFHAVLYRPADRARTLAFLENLHKHIDCFVRLQIDLNVRKEVSQAEHEAILSACENKDAELAKSHLKNHIEGVGELISRYEYDGS